MRIYKVLLTILALMMVSTSSLTATAVTPAAYSRCSCKMVKSEGPTVEYCTGHEKSKKGKCLRGISSLPALEISSYEVRREAPVKAQVVAVFDQKWACLDFIERDRLCRDNSPAKEPKRVGRW